MDFGSCSDASDVVSMDGFPSFEKCECKFPDCFLVVITEFIKVLIKLGDFHWGFVGDVFVDVFISKMLFDTLFDVVFAEHDYCCHVLICPDDDDFFVFGEEVESSVLQA